MVVIGDEILGGYVTDTNSPWLADRLRAHGVALSRVHVVPDEMAAIDEALGAELRRGGPRIVVTSGGVGSTPDDLTYEGVAASLGRRLVEEPRIVERLQGVLDWSRAQGLEVTDEFAWHLMRMARIPEGGRLLLRDGGWVPGVAVDVDGGADEGGATVVVLPGVPSEFRSILSEVVEPTMLAGRNPLPTVVEIEHGFPESALNLTFAALADRLPQVKLGSYPGRPMLVRLTGAEEEVEVAAGIVRDAIRRLEEGPAGAGLRSSWERRRAGDEEDV